MGEICVTVNGEKIKCPEGYTVANLAAKLGAAGKSAVAELDGEILSKNEFENRILKNGSELELIRFVGGG